MLIADDTTWLAFSTVLSAIITVGGSVAVAVITTRQNRTENKVNTIHEQLKTSNGSTVGELVEKVAQKQEEGTA